MQLMQIWKVFCDLSKYKTICVYIHTNVYCSHSEFHLQDPCTILNLHPVHSNCMWNLPFSAQNHFWSSFEKQPWCTRKFAFQNNFVVEIRADPQSIQKCCGIFSLALFYTLCIISSFIPRLYLQYLMAKFILVQLITYHGKLQSAVSIYLSRRPLHYLPIFTM
jgi:hypothetical protein